MNNMFQVEFDIFAKIQNKQIENETLGKRNTCKQGN
jgi:hypothetical protein